MDRLDAMYVLLAVVEAGSLSAAARKLNVPLPTVSRRIADLEAYLGARILVRSSRRVSLTDAGVTYVEASRQILDRLQEVERAVSGAYSEPKGKLTITSPTVLGKTHVMPIIIEFLRAYPAIDIRLRFSDQISPFAEGQIDLALRVGNLPDSSLIAAPIGNIRRVTCASPAYLAARGIPQLPDDLMQHDCITFDNLASSDAWRFGGEEGMSIVPVHSRLTVSGAEAAVQAAIEGIGLASLLSYQVADAHRNGTLQVVLAAYELPAWPVNFVYAGQQLLPRKLTAFLNFATPRLRARFAEETASFDTIPKSGRTPTGPMT
jgi:DNA-binding transcriptional LysR family regulator